MLRLFAVLAAVIAFAGCAAAPGVAREEPLVLEDHGLLPVELPHMREPDPAQAVGGYEVRELPVRAGLVHGIHGSMVEETALTEDGRVAVTLAGTGLRLWPSVDGKHEPVAITPAPGSGLQLVRDGDELVIAGLELTGAIGLVRTTALGVQRARLEIIAPRPIVAMRATARGILAVRDDQVIELVDLRGARRGVLVPEPGERISSIVQRRGHTLALLATPDGVRGRWIVESDAGLAWGTATPMLPIDPSRAALSPDGVHLAAVRAGAVTMVYVNLATGRAIAIPAPEPLFGPDFVESVHPIGFTDRHTLAFATQFGALAWWDGQTSTRGYLTPSHSRSEFVERDVTAGVGDGHAVVGASTFIVVEKPGESHTFGYKDPTLSVAYPHGNGWWLPDDERHGFIEVDDRFQERRRLDVPADLGTVQSAVPLDQRHVAVIAGDYRDRALYRIDLEGEEYPEPLGRVDGYYPQYNRDTHLLAISGYREHVFAHVDAATGALGPLVRQTLAENASHRVVLVDPASNDGLVAYEYVNHRDGTQETLEVRGICESCDDPVRIGRRHVEPPDHIRQYEVTLGQRVVSPDRAHVAITDGTRARLLDKNGQERWALPARGISAFQWSRRGELVATNNGLAHVELATGAIVDGQCGWLFGELPEPPHNTFGSPSVCDLE